MIAGGSFTLFNQTVELTARRRIPLRCGERDKFMARYNIFVDLWDAIPAREGTVENRETVCLQGRGLSRVDRYIPAGRGQSKMEKTIYLQGKGQSSR